MRALAAVVLFFGASALIVMVLGLFGGIGAAELGIALVGAAAATAVWLRAVPRS